MTIVSKGAKRTDGLRSIEAAMLVVEEIAKSCPVSSALFHAGLMTALRGSDLRELAWEEVIPALESKAESITVKQKKTKSLVVVPLDEDTRDLFVELMNNRGNNVYVFQMDSQRSKGKPISRSKAHVEIQAASNRLKAAGLLPADFVLGSHSARKTIATLAHKDGESLPVISHMLGHKSTDVTLRYLGINNDDVKELKSKYRFRKA